MTKFEKNNRLLSISNFPLNKQFEQHHVVTNNNINYDSLLNHALISYTNKNIDFITFSYNQNKWFLSKQDKTHLLELFTTNHFKPLTLTNHLPLTNSKINPTALINSIDITEKKIHISQTSY